MYLCIFLLGTELETKLRDVSSRRRLEHDKLKQSIEEQKKGQWSRKETYFGKESIRLETALENANNQLELDETEICRYCKCQDLKQQTELLRNKLKSSEDKVIDLSRNCEKSAQKWLRKVEGLKKEKKELENRLMDIKTQKERAENNNTTLYMKCEKQTTQIDTLKVKLELSKKKDQKNVSRKCKRVENELKTERVQWSKKELDFEKAKSNLETELKVAKAKLDHAENDKRQCCKITNDLRQHLEELNSKLQCVERNEFSRNFEKELEHERVQWSKKEHDFLKERRELTKALEEAKNTQERTESDKSRYFKERNDLQQQIEELTNKLQCFEDEKNKQLLFFEQKLEREKGKWSRKEEDFEKTKEVLETALRNAKSGLLLAKTNYSEKYNDLEKQITELMSELQRSEDEKKEISRRFVEQPEWEKSQLSRKREDSVEEKKELEKSLEDANNQLKIAENDNSQHLNKCNDLRQQREDLEKKLQSSEDERKDLVKKFKDLDRQKTLNERKCSKKVNDLEKKNKELETTLLDMNVKKKGAERDKEQCSTKCEKLEDQLRKLKIKFQQSKEEDKKRSSKCYDAEQQLKRERGEWSKKERNFRREQREMENSLADATSRLERAEGENSRYSKKCNDLKQETVELKNKLQRSERKLSRNFKQ